MLFLFATKEQSLKKILEKLIDEITVIQTIGASPKHDVSPQSIQKLKSVKEDIAKLLKE